MTEVRDDSHFRFSLLLKEVDNLRCKEGVSAIALVLIQLDGMQEINERFGYLGGDKVLKEFAVRLASVIGHKGLTFEISGTSFALLMEDPLHEGDAVAAAEKIAHVASDPVPIGTGKARVRARMGISVLPDPAETAEEMLRQCELALMQARNHGETYRVFTPDLVKGPHGASVSWFDVDEAIRKGEFELHYQPRIDLRSGELTGAEALVRWQSPRAGMIPPSYFFSDITSTVGLRNMLDFVLNSALEFGREWIGRIPRFVMSVDIAPGNLADPDLLMIVENALERWNYPAERLVLEVSEQALVPDEDLFVVQLTKLRSRGVRIAMDNFGTGLIRIASLKYLPIDLIKIDKSLIASIPSHQTDRGIVAAIVQLAQAVNIDVVAEGIEDDEILQALLAIGCESGVGFHVSRPISAAEFSTEWAERFARPESQLA